MDTIRDNELILYHYRDGLDAGTEAAIAQALAGSAELRARYAALCATLQAVDAQPPLSPAPDFEQRLWQRWEQRTGATAPRDHAAAARRPRTHHRGGLRPAWRHAATALAVVAALGLGFLLGRQPPAPQPDPPTTAATSRSDLSARVLDAYVVAHLRETEGVVLTAVNSDSAALLAGNRELAADLLDSNRLYARAAARAGNVRLATFLQQLEPLLIELANPAASAPIQDSDGLRSYVDKTDLLFQLRATQARMEPQRSTSI